MAPKPVDEPWKWGRAEIGTMDDMSQLGLIKQRVIAESNAARAREEEMRGAHTKGMKSYTAHMRAAWNTVGRAGARTEMLQYRSGLDHCRVLKKGGHDNKSVPLH